MIDGKIVSVMESWPLQLIVETATDRYNVLLLLETMITRRGVKISAGELNPSLRVLIKGHRSSENQFAMTAQQIEILE